MESKKALDSWLKWIDGCIVEWNCPHVNKCDVLVDGGDGLYKWNTDYPEPVLPYRYVILYDLYEELEVDSHQRQKDDGCNCIKD